MISDLTMQSRGSGSIPGGGKRLCEEHDLLVSVFGYLINIFELCLYFNVLISITFITKAILFLTFGIRSIRLKYQFNTN